jgi:hypothetical protein
VLSLESVQKETDLKTPPYCKSSLKNRIKYISWPVGQTENYSLSPGELIFVPTTSSLTFIAPQKLFALLRSMPNEAEKVHPQFIFTTCSPSGEKVSDFTLILLWCFQSLNLFTREFHHNNCYPIGEKLI